MMNLSLTIPQYRFIKTYTDRQNEFCQYFAMDVVSIRTLTASFTSILAYVLATKAK